VSEFWAPHPVHTSTSLGLLCLLIGDYLSMPLEKGGYHTVGLYLDTFTQHIWGFKFKTAGMSKMMVKALEALHLWRFSCYTTGSTSKITKWDSVVRNEAVDTMWLRHIPPGSMAWWKAPTKSCCMCWHVYVRPRSAKTGGKP
jgi:hypothetical protein